MSAMDLRALRDAFGTFMTGVTVVTTMNAEGKPAGFTANSFSSVSLDPPLLLVSIARGSRNWETFTTAPGFAINILSEGQKDVSNAFSRPVEDRFAAVKWQRGPAGSPVIENVSAWFDCTLHQVVEAGDHAILIGRIEAFDASQEPGLGYYRGSYFTPASTGTQVPAGPDVMVSAIIEAECHVLLEDDGKGGMTLPSARVGREGLQPALDALIARTGLNAAPGFIYSVYDDTIRGRQHIAFLCPAARTEPQHGNFVALSPEGLGRVSDPAIRIMLDRLAAENRMGNYGVYFGNYEQGRVARAGERNQT